MAETFDPGSTGETGATPELRARAVLECLHRTQDERILDLTDQARDLAYTRLRAVALAMLDSSDVTTDRREAALVDDVVLAEVSFEQQGRLAEAAVLVALIHDRLARHDDSSRLRKILCRFKIAGLLWHLDEHCRENQEQCLQLADRSIARLLPLQGSSAVNLSSVAFVLAELGALAGHLNVALQRHAEAGQRFLIAAENAPDLNDMAAFTVRAAGAISRSGDPQQAYDLLIGLERTVDRVCDVQTREHWEATREALRFELGGSPAASPRLGSRSTRAERLNRLLRDAFETDAAPDHLPDDLVPLLRDELEALEATDLPSRHAVHRALASQLALSGSLAEAGEHLEAAACLEDRLDDPRAILERQLVQANWLRLCREPAPSASAFTALLPAVRQELSPGRQLHTLGHLLECLAEVGLERGRLESLAEEMLCLLDRALETQPAPAARRRARELLQRPVEVLLRALLAQAAAVGFETPQSQQLLAIAWRAVLASRNPELRAAAARWRGARGALDPSLHDLEHAFHRALNEHILHGTCAGQPPEWLERLEELQDHELAAPAAGPSAGRPVAEVQRRSPAGEPVRLAFFQIRELFQSPKTLVLARLGDHIAPRLLDETEERSVHQWAEQVELAARSPEGTASGPETSRDLSGARPAPSQEIGEARIGQVVPPELYPTFVAGAMTRLDLLRAASSAQPCRLFPDGRWHQVPFEMLSVAEHGPITLGRYRSVEICLRGDTAAPGETTIDLSRGWLGLGGIPGRGPFSDLPGSEAEVGQLQQELSAAGFPAAVLLGADAHLDALDDHLRTHRPGILHIATHGTSDPRHPEASALLLAPVPDEPGQELLPFRRIRRLELASVDLVVLSACWSSAGRSSRAAGMEGLAWAFLEAGVRQVIASRYPVDDQATVSFMTVLYQHLATHPVAEALGRARNECLMPAIGLSPLDVGSWSVLA